MPQASAMLVAHAAPAMPQPSRNISSSFNGALSSATVSIRPSVTRVRPMPLKKPDTAHSATASGAPSSRGHQYSTASASIAGASANGRSTSVPQAASSTNSGLIASATHSPVHSERAASWWRPAPWFWATSVCTPMPTPPSRKIAPRISQWIAPIAAVASVDNRPTYHVSVRFSAACTALLANNGAASRTTAR